MKRPSITLLAAAGVAFIVGFGVAPQTDPQVVTKTVTAPAPTPQVVTVEVPGPQPTPQIITKTETVAVTPRVCVDAIIGLDAALQVENDILTRIDAGKAPTQTQINAFLDLDPEAIYRAAGQCLDAADIGS